MINYKREYKGVEGGPIDVNTLDRKKKKKTQKLPKECLSQKSCVADHTRVAVKPTCINFYSCIYISFIGCTPLKKDLNNFI